MAADAQVQHLQVYGLLQDETFHVAKACAETLHQKMPEKFSAPDIKPMVEFEWEEYLQGKRKELKGEMWAFQEKIISFANGQMLGGHQELIKWAQDNHEYQDFRPPALYLALAEEAYKNRLSNGRTFAYLDISIGGEAAGRLLFELYTDKVPKTCENFRALCTGEKGRSKDSNIDLHYKGSIFHRAVRNGWIQGGDIPNGRGDAGESIYGPVFEDENFAVPHDRRGVLGMANQGRHTNGSQFYITMQPTAWMNTKYVAFGQLIEGTALLQRLEDQATYNERPKADCRVEDCGVLQPDDVLAQAPAVNGH
ncbi:putative inactive peptidyl-prolyl cis-trans isomerase-like 6 [Branchiostoma floridae x Branchiostoma japonicum]